MTALVLSSRAQIDLQRLCDFLADQHPEDAMATASVLLQGLAILAQQPCIGRPVQDGLRELVIRRGRSGYLALYRFVPEQDAVRVLSLRHHREANY